MGKNKNETDLEKHVTEHEQDKKDVIISKYVAESKILKIINRMCNGELLNVNQFDTIFDYVRKKGHQSTIREEWYHPVWENGNLVRHEKQIHEVPGYRYLGIFAKVEGMENILVFGDTRRGKISSVKRYKSGQIIYY